jgi:DNA uptake protein ComE-like DNA-binding protein
MQGNVSQLSSGRSQAVSLGANHGYRFEGDTAYLNAELAFDARDSVDAESWALQLWACDAPYQGGPLRGIKVAEAALALDGASEHLEANAIAQLPPAQRDYAMVLVLAADGQVHDFSNYAERQSFVVPHLTESVGYRFEDADVVLHASIENPRPSTNLSGTLALELWALAERYQGGPLSGTRMAQVELGSLNGESTREVLELRAPRAQPPVGEWQLALVLREWTESGYQTRDFCSFPVAYRVEPSVRVVSAPVPVPAVAPEAVVAPASAPAPVEEPVSAPEPVRSSPPVLELVRSPAPAPEPERAPEPVSTAEPVSAAEPKAAVSPPVRARAEEPEAPPAKEPAKLALKARAAEPQRVSISRSSVAELAAVDGLNLKLAQTIVRARPYTSLDDLKRVRGIGDKLLLKLRAQLSL